MRLNLNEFLTDDDIHTLWGIAGRIIDSGAVIDNQDYEISLSLLAEDPKSDNNSSENYGSKVDALVDSMDVTVNKAAHGHVRKDLDTL